MIGLVIGLFILAALTALYLNSKTRFNSQSGLADVQSTRRAVLTTLGNGIRSAGYFVDPVDDNRAAVFPASGRFAAGQFITGSDGTANTSDTITLRFETPPGNALPDCMGGGNKGDARAVVENTLTVNANGELTCAVNNGTAVAVASGVKRMELRYGVDTDGDGQPDRYLSADAVSGARLWPSVHAVRARLVLRDPVTGNAQSAATLPPLVHVIALMNHP